RLPWRPRFAHSHPRMLESARYQSGDALLDLEAALDIFANRRYPWQQLALDLKDFGFERHHVELVTAAGLDRETAWMSWIPQSLVALREAGATGPLILAHCNLSRFGPLGAICEAAVSRAELRLGPLVIRGRDRVWAASRTVAHGFQHGLVCARLPDSVERFLAANGGGICLNSILIDDSVMRYCQDAGLRLWVYRVTTVRGFARYASFRPIERV